MEMLVTSAAIALPDRDWDADWLAADLTDWPESGQWCRELDGWSLSSLPGESDTGLAARSIVHLRWPRPFASARRVSIEFDLSSAHGHLCLRLGEDWCCKPFSFVMNASGVRVCSEISNHILAENQTVRLRHDRPQRVRIDGREEEICLWVDGVEGVRLPLSRPNRYRQFTLFSNRELRLSRLHVRAAGLMEAVAVPARRSLLITSSLDFCHGHKPDRRFDDLPHFMRQLAGLGVQRVNWIVQDWCSDAKQHEGFTEARRNGMAVTAVIKWPEFGKTDWTNPGNNRTPAARFGFEHPEVYSCRAPLDDTFATDDQPLHRLELVFDQAAELNPCDFSLWVGDDARSWRPFTGGGQPQSLIEVRSAWQAWHQRWEDARPVRVLRWSGLALKHPCVAVVYRPQRGDAIPPGNQLHRLLAGYAADGRKVYAQWGLRFGLNELGAICSPNIDLYAGNAWDNDDFGSVGPGWLGGPDRSEWIWRFSAQGGVLALRRHFEPITDRLFSPAVPAMRRFFIDLAMKTMDWGADAIDLRVLNHLRSIDLTDMHFNPEVCREYEARHAKPLTRRTVDRVQHQMLMADFYTQFIREVSTAVRGRGGKMHHHINCEFDASPAVRGLLSMWWDWRRWISEGLLDGIFLKEVRPGTAFFDEVADEARRHGLPMVLSRSGLSLFASDPQAPAVLGRFLAEAQAWGLDGYDLYDGRHLIDDDGRGGLACRRPDIAAVLAADPTTTKMD